MSAMPQTALPAQINRTVVVHHVPGPHGYRDITVHAPDEAIAPAALDLEPMPLAELFAAA